MNDRQENTRRSASKSGLHKTVSDEISQPAPQAKVLPEARKIGQREAMYLYAERRVLDAVQVEFHV